MDDHFWLGSPDGRCQLLLVQRIGERNLHTHGLECPGFLGSAHECYHLVPILYQMRHEEVADRSGAACDKYSHGSGL